MAGLKDEIILSFMIVGHTRCSVDGGFGSERSIELLTSTPQNSLLQQLSLRLCRTKWTDSAGSGEIGTSFAFEIPTDHWHNTVPVLPVFQGLSRRSADEADLGE